MGRVGGSDTLPSLGPSLRPLDLEFMKHLSKVVNIIPVIAKADTMTLEEKSEFKQRVSHHLSLSVLLCPPLGPSHFLLAMSSTYTLFQFPTLTASHLIIQEARARSSWTKGTYVHGVPGCLFLTLHICLQRLPDTLTGMNLRSHCSSVRVT